MKRLTFSFTRAIVLTTLALVASVSLFAVENNPAEAAQTTGCVPGAAIVQSTNMLGQNELLGVDGVSRADVWAVGSYYTPTTGTLLPLLAHWNGMDWLQTPNPDYGNNNVGNLNAVAALSANDVWAVGSVYNRSGGSSSRALIQRWDGARWNVVPTPTPPGDRPSSSLNAVYARASNDVWAVGSYIESGSIRALTMRWDGAQWTIVPNPTPTYGTGAILYGVDGIAANDVWAVGELAGSQYGNFFILHWDGAQWSEVNATGFGALRGVEAIATNDVWAVGYQLYGEAVTIHWNGTQWSAVPNPTPQPGYQVRLQGVTATSSSNVWAVGQITNSPSSSDYRNYDSYVQRWDGSRWSVVEDAVAGSSKLFGVTGVEGEIWAVGGFDTPQTLAEKWDGSRWSITPTPNPGRAHNSLSAIEVIAPDNIWAVGQFGFYSFGGNSYTRPLIQHWDGTRWSNVPVPFPSTPETVMSDITAISPNDIWAVGMTGVGGDFYTYTLHWDGSEWIRIPSPNANESPHYLQAVDGTAWNNLWAVGFIFDQYPDHLDRSFIMHWNGLAWNIIPSPNVAGESNQLHGIDVLSANSAWAVGSHSDLPERGALLLRWNGTAWSRAIAPGVEENVTLASVSALSENDIWAVGSELVGEVERTLTIHWNGAQWSKVPSPNFGTSSHYLGAVKAIAPNDVWAVGYFQGGTLMLHWNGSQWSIRTITTPGQLFNGLSDVDASGPQDVWAVGGYSSGGPGDTLVQHVGRFSDVSPTDFFYTPVNSLVARGAIGGYNDCTFRPQDNVTRGQVSKIVALAEGWALANPPQAAFADVPRGSTFYRYVETLLARGTLGGYPCGGPGEPCDAQRRPYFRPNVDITRAQIAKVVVLARGWALVNPSNATFADVPPGSTFYGHIETAVAHGILSGYPCGGGPAEACDAQRRPYFRPNNNATRGQIAKIVYNAVGP